MQTQELRHSSSLRRPVKPPKKQSDFVPRTNCTTCCLFVGWLQCKLVRQWRNRTRTCCIVRQSPSVISYNNLYNEFVLRSLAPDIFTIMPLNLWRTWNRTIRSVLPSRTSILNYSCCELKINIHDQFIVNMIDHWPRKMDNSNVCASRFGEVGVGWQIARQINKNMVAYDS